MNADGSAPTRLTSDAWRDSRPVWSPDGTTIAFASDRDGAFDLYLMNVDGSSMARLIDDPAEAGEPVWQL
jgi:Tol biopolymer transport system component